MGDNTNEINQDDIKPAQPSQLDAATSQSAVDLGQNQDTVAVPVHLPIQAPSRSKKPLVWTIAIVVVLLLVSGGAYYFMTMTKSTDTVTTATIPPVASSSPKLANGAEQLVTEAKKLLKGTPVATVKTDSYGATDAHSNEIYSLASYAIGNNTFATQPSKGYGAAIASTDQGKTMESNYQALISYLEKQQFTKKSSYPGTPSGPLVASAVYASKDIACAISKRSYALIESTTKAPFEYATAIGCADMTEYEKAAELVKPFAAAAAKADATNGSSLPQYSADVVVHEGANGYKNAAVAVDAGTGLFYQEPGKDWVRWVYTTNDTQPCTDYTTPILKKAFANEDCLDKKTNRTVKVSTLL